MGRGRRGLGVGVSLLASAALVGTALAPGAAGADEDELADWTFMVYAVGDTDNVAEIMVQNLSQLAAVPDDAEVNVVLMVDLPTAPEGPPPTSTLPGVGEFDTAKLFVLGDGRFNEVRDLGEVAMGRPDVLADFIEEAAGLYPAEKYALTLFDHGAGNDGGYYDLEPGDTHLNVPQMRDGIAAGLARAGIDELDLIYHAACLLSNYETASALAPLSKTMAGSEEIMTLYPVSPAGLVPLAEDADGVEVAKALVDGYRSLLEDPEVGLGAGNRELMAMSVIDSEPMSRLDDALEAFADSVVPRMDELAPDVARARARTFEFARPFGYDGFNLVDLGDFLRPARRPAGRGRGRPQRGLRGAPGCRAVPGDRPWHRADDRSQRLLPDRPPGGPRLPHRRDDAGRLGEVPRRLPGRGPVGARRRRWPSPSRPPTCSRRDRAGSRSRAGSPRARPPPRPPTC